jgi:hypothetical protein
MPEPTIVPPPPTVTQPSAPSPPVDNSPGLEQVQRAFDKVLPERKPSRPADSPPEAPKPAPAETPAPEKPPASPAPPTIPPVEKPGEVDVPSFLEQALRGESAPPAPGTDQAVASAAADADWPEELPEFKNSEEARSRYKKWRETYNNQKTELRNLREKPVVSEEQQRRMQVLEDQNRQMQSVLSRVGVEQSQEFQQQIMRPLHASWNEAARLVKDNGADPQELAKAMTLSGRAQFEALDMIFSSMPESARTEIHDALRTYRRFEEARRQTIANAPQALEGIRRREMDRQMTEINRQREDMKGTFDRAVRQLRDDGKLEVLLKTDIPEGTWWNEQGDKILESARNLYLENTDMEKVARACLLAPAAEAYRKLWLNSQKKIGQLQKVINERINGEPNLSESSGSQRILTPDAQMQDDLKRPFHEVFLREFHKSQAAQR